MNLQQEKYCFKTTREQWRKEYLQTKGKSWFQFLADKLENYEEDKTHYAAK